MTASDERCAMRRDELSAYHDRALEPAAAARIADHLIHCRDCREHLAMLAEVDRAIASLPAPEPTLAEQEALVARVAALRGGAPSAARVEKRRSWWRGLTPRVLAPLAAAAVVMVIVLRVGDREFIAPPAGLRGAAPAPDAAPVPEPAPEPLTRGHEESAAPASGVDQATAPAGEPDAKTGKMVDEALPKRALEPEKKLDPAPKTAESAPLATESERQDELAGDRANEPKGMMSKEQDAALARDRASFAAETPPPAPEVTMQKEKGTSGGRLQESSPAAVPAPPPVVRESPAPVSAPAPPLATDFRLTNPELEVEVVKSRLRAGDLPGARVAMEGIQVGALPESLAVEVTQAGFEIATRSSDAADCARAEALADTVLGRFPTAAVADSLRAARTRLPCAAH